LTEGVELGQTQGVVAVGLAFEVLELPGLAGGVGHQQRKPSFGAEIVNPASEQAASMTTTGGLAALEEFGEACAVGGEGVETSALGLPA